MITFCLQALQALQKGQAQIVTTPGQPARIAMVPKAGITAVQVNYNHKIQVPVLNSIKLITKTYLPHLISQPLLDLPRMCDLDFNHLCFISLEINKKHLGERKK